MTEKPNNALLAWLGLEVPPFDQSASPAPNAVPEKDSPAHAFLMAEYGSLAETMNGREERIDRFFAIYLALAGAPFVVFAALLKDKNVHADLSDIPPIVAAIFIFAAFAGFGIVRIVTQLRFSTILYIRAMNAIRAVYALQPQADQGLLLPRSRHYPTYNEGLRWHRNSKRRTSEQTKYMFEAIFAMAVVNAMYLGIGMKFFPSVLPLSSTACTWGPWAAAVGLFFWHMRYYFRSAKAREERGRIGI